MKSKYFRRIFGTAMMVITMGLGLAIAAQAQSPWDYRRQQEERRRQEELQRQQQQQYQIYQQQNDRWRGRGRNWDGYPNWGGGYELRQTALNAGYNEGVKAGRNDRNRRGGYYGYGSDFTRFGSYRNATKDYNSRFGDRELYRRYFQMAFQNGYADGVRGY